MKLIHEQRISLLAAAVAAVLASAATAEEAAKPDTSGWACEKCPFDRGYRADTELGGIYVDESSAKFGNYTGLDEEGGYVLANAEGKSSHESGYVLEYSLENLGLDSRSGIIEGGKQVLHRLRLDPEIRLRHDRDALPRQRRQPAHFAGFLGQLECHQRHDGAAVDAA